MRPPRRRLLGLTWVGWLNFLVLRWLLVRLAYNSEPGRPVEWSLLRWYRPIPWSPMLKLGRGDNDPKRTL